MNAAHATPATPTLASCARQRRDHAIRPRLYLILRPEGVDPMDLEAPVTGTDIDLAAIEQTCHMMLHTIEYKIDAAARRGRTCETEFAPVDCQRGSPLPVTQRRLALGAIRLPEQEAAMPRANSRSSRRR